MLCWQSMWFIWMLFGLFLIFMDRSEGFHACWSLPVKKISVNWGDSSQTGQPGKQRIKHIEIRRSPDRFSKATHFGEIIYSTYSWLNRLSPLLRHAKKAHQFSKSSTKQIPFFGAQSFGSVLTHEHLAAKSRNFQGPFSPSPNKATCVLKLGGPVGSLIYN